MITKFNPTHFLQLSTKVIASCSLALFFFISTASIGNSQTPQFDQNNAYSLLQKQCDFGPRNPGSQSRAKCKDWLIQQLKAFGGEVIEQKFTAFDPHAGRKQQLSNIAARFNDLDQRPLMLCAHWDSRPVADRERDPKKAAQPIIGANDGASGVAILLEIARLIAENPPERAILIVLFDGEDLGRATYPDEFAQGSRYWALHPVPDMPSEAILLDMVGDADLEIAVEYYSRVNASRLQRTLWEIAAEIGSTAFVDRPGPAVEDDHLPLINAGIPAVDLIDFDYPYWHTSEDTPDKCSPASLGQVGRVLVEYIYR